MRIRFISGNEFKIEEARKILSLHEIDVVPVKLKLEELQSFDVTKIVEDKAIQAYHSVGWPLFVEHTVLLLDALKGFPGGLTEVFWETLKPEGICEIVGHIGKDRVIARTHVAYCDGKDIKIFTGEIHGKIAPTPRTQELFQWDCVFIPEGHTQTFAEMGDRKHSISMRALALNKLANHLMAA
jgi:XTP/dITP diphosphohydrolase